MTQHTRKPTSEQYITVCQKLIGKFPSLKDTEGDSPFVSNVFLLGFMLNVYFQASWRLSLRNSFKNFRRKGSDCHHDEPPSKRMKFHLKDLPEITEEEYEEAIENLKAELKKGGKRMGKHSAVKHLMELTRAKRCQWVQQDRPLISEVVEKFPCLAFSKWVRICVQYIVFYYVLIDEIFQMRREFQAILQLECNVNSLMDTWVEWSTRIVEFSKAESSSRPYIKKKLKKLDEAENFPYPDGT